MKGQRATVTSLKFF
jgi:hypothetical protein